jgi:outer membrane lipoprotein SlyB
MALASHNVVAAFLEDSQVESALRSLESQDIPQSVIFVDDRDDEAALSKFEMREEVERSWAGPGVSMGTEHMMRGAVLWTVVGGAAGLLLGLVIGALVFGGLLGVLAAAAAGAFAGSSAGFVAGGFTKPRPVERAHTQAQRRRRTIGVHSDDQEQVERAGILLAEHGADRIERMDSEGNPLPELHERSGTREAPSRTGRRLRRTNGDE